MYVAIQIDDPKKRAGLTTSKFIITHDTPCQAIRGKIEWRGGLCGCIVFSNTKVIKRCSAELFRRAIDLLTDRILNDQNTNVRLHLIYVENETNIFTPEQQGIIWQMLMHEIMILSDHSSLSEVAI